MNISKKLLSRLSYPPHTNSMTFSKLERIDQWHSFKLNGWILLRIEIFRVDWVHRDTNRNFRNLKLRCTRIAFSVCFPGGIFNNWTDLFKSFAIEGISITSLRDCVFQLTYIEKAERPNNWLTFTRCEVRLFAKSRVYSEPTVRESAFETFGSIGCSESSFRRTWSTAVCSTLFERLMVVVMASLRQAADWEHDERFGGWWCLSSNGCSEKWYLVEDHFVILKKSGSTAFTLAFGCASETAAEGSSAVDRCEGLAGRVRRSRPGRGKGRMRAEGGEQWRHLHRAARMIQWNEMKWKISKEQPRRISSPMPRPAREDSNWLYQIFAVKVSRIRIPFIL
jgi:hypothetical protein